jgi:hypothetical protein
VLETGIGGAESTKASVEPYLVTHPAATTGRALPMECCEKEAQMTGAGHAIRTAFSTTRSAAPGVGAKAAPHWQMFKWASAPPVTRSASSALRAQQRGLAMPWIPSSVTAGSDGYTWVCKSDLCVSETSGAWWAKHSPRRFEIQQYVPRYQSEETHQGHRQPPS